MQKVLFFFLSLMLSYSLSGQKEKRITILHTNDIHSRLTGYAPESAYTPLSANDDKTIGGFVRIATLIKTEKESNPGTTLAIDAGDFLMGTLFHTMEENSGFQLRLMKSIGYDVTCIGNHEFDFGPSKLASIISNSAERGDIPYILAGNLEFSKSDMADDGLEKLYSDEIIIRKLVLTKDSLKIGLFSIIGKDASNVAPNSAPVTFTKQFTYAKKMVRELRDEKCDLIICISHSGLLKDESGEWGGEDFNLARKVKGIDLIISAHTHTTLISPLIVNDVPIIQAGEYGKYLGRLEILFSEGKLKVESYKLIPVDDKIIGDSGINQLIEEQKVKIESEILKPIGLDYNTPVVETDFILEGNETGNFLASNIGPMIADAIHYYVNKNAAGGTDISLVAAGVIRDRFVPGIQTVPDIFKVMSLGSGKDNVPGYPLARLYVTGKELKSILEVLQVAYKSSPDNYCYYSGIRVSYNPEKGLLRKISKIEIVHSDGSLKNVNFSRKDKTLYSVTANSYILEFFGIIKKMSFGLINVVPRDVYGNRVTDMKKAVVDIDSNTEGIQEGKEWLALMQFLKNMPDIDGNGIPDIDSKYAVPVKCFMPVNVR